MALSIHSGAFGRAPRCNTVKAQRLLLLVSGAPGAGKSTLAKSLAPVFNAVLLDKDCVDEAFSPGNRGSWYEKKILPRVIDALLRLAEINLRAGTNVILDAPWTMNFHRFPDLKSRIQRMARSVGAELKILECKIQEPLLRQRLQQRGLARDAEKLTTSGWKKFEKSSRLVNPLPHTVIPTDGADAVNKAIFAVLGYRTKRK
jgi:predicted kinase